jgi:hypothetical protein
MKKIILFFALLVAITATAQEPNNLIAPDSTGTDTLITEPVTLPDFAGDLNTWMEGCGAELIMLVQDGKVAVPTLIAELTGAPKPNTLEGVQYWTETIDWLWAAGRSLITTVVVFLLSLFKSKDAAATAGSSVQRWFDNLKTRYLVAFTAPVVTLIGLVAFKGDGWSWLEAAGWILGTGAGSMFIAQLLEWLNIKGLNLTAKKAAA